LPEKRLGGNGQSAEVGTTKRARVVRTKRHERCRSGRNRVGKSMRMTALVDAGWCIHCTVGSRRSLLGADGCATNPATQAVLYCTVPLWHAHGHPLVLVMVLSNANCWGFTFIRHIQAFKVRSSQIDLCA
jgi:hypothetical protein